MSNEAKMPTVLKKLRNLKQIEFRLQKQWESFKTSGGEVHSSFLTALADLEARALELERMLDA